MFYLIGQIAVTLLFTALIGITMGWLLRGLGTSRQLETIEARWRARVAQLEQRSDSAAEVVTGGDPAFNEQAGRQIAELEKQVRQRDELLASLQSAKQPGANAKSLARRLQETTELSDQLQQHVDEQTSAIEQLRAQVKKVNSDREMLVDRLRDRESEIGRMSQERQHAINTIASLQKEMRTMRGERLAAAESAAGKTPAAPGPARPAIPPPQTDLAADKTRHEAGRARQPASPATTTGRTGRPAPDISETPASRPAPPDPAEPTVQQDLPIADGPKKQATPQYDPTWRLSAPQGPKDNLQAIFGIGPKLEMQLNKLGIFHFEQIGRFQRNDILWVARHLKSFPGRIVRDRWIEQAQTLANQKRG